MKDKIEKMLAYLDLAEQSKKREYNISELPYYKTFGSEYERKRDLSFQRKVTQRLLNRVQTLKREL
jgi:hypothetical protein